MASRALLLSALLCVAFGTAASAGRKLSQDVDNSGLINALTVQDASNLAEGSNNINQANANQNAQAAGNGSAASNSASVAQTNGRKLFQDVDNSGSIEALTEQAASNEAINSNNVNQANANQNAQAAGNGAAAANNVSVAQSNGRKLLQDVDNSGAIEAVTEQDASNEAVDSTNVNQANANQNAQAAGNGAAANNAVAVDQSNGRKLLQDIDNSGSINAVTQQDASNEAVNSNNVNQANANQNAQAAGNGATASNAVAVDQSND